MNLSMVMLLVPMLLTAITSAWLAAYAWRWRQRPGVSFFMLFAVCQVVWLTGYIFEVISPTLEMKMFWDSIQWVPFTLTGITLTEFTVRYTQQEALLPLRARQLIALPAPVFILLALTNPLHSLIYVDPQIVRTEYFDIFTYPITPLFALITLYAIGGALVSLVLLAVRMRSSSQAGRVQLVYVFSAILIALVVICVPVASGWTFLGLRDLTPFGFALSNGIMAIGIFRNRLFHIVPVARDLIIQSLSEIVVVVGADGRVMDHNRSLERFTTADVLVGEHAARVVPFWGALMARKGDGDLRAFYFHDDVRLNIEEREYVFNVFVNPIHQPDGSILGVIVVARDVTAKRAREAARHERDQLNRALETERALNEMRTHFMHRVVHEFRTPLSVIRLNHDILRRHGDQLTMEQRAEKLDRIAYQIDQLNDMLQQLQDALERRDAIRVELTSVGLSAMLDEVLASLHPALLGGRVIERAIAPDADTALLDPTLLRLWLSNLISNACKYSPPDSRIEVSARAEDGTLLLEVRDYGIGIPAEALPRLFEPFYRAPNASRKPGIGLGLVLVRDTVRAHGGDIHISGCGDEPGTRVTLTLPGTIVGSG
jgi:signal transduction histidine kinase